MPDTKTFKDLYLAGKTQLKDIDDFIDDWHSTLEFIDLHTYLGLTYDQLRRWVYAPDTLNQILKEK